VQLPNLEPTFPTWPVGYAPVKVPFLWCTRKTEEKVNLRFASRHRGMMLPTQSRRLPSGMAAYRGELAARGCGLQGSP
jgi:hypothetical protein